MLEMFYLSSMILPLLANKIEESNFGKGLKNLANDASSVVIGLCFSMAVLWMGITAIKLQGADDQEQATLKKRQKVIVTACIVGTCASGLLKLGLSYFK